MARSELKSGTQVTEQAAFSSPAAVLCLRDGMPAARRLKSRSLFHGPVRHLLNLTLATSVSLVVLTCSSTVVRADVTVLSPELPDQNSTEAFKKYWGSFEQYEAKMLKDSTDMFQKRWNELQEQRRKQDVVDRKSKLETLQKAAASFKANLKEHGSAPSRGLTALGLGQALTEIAELTQQTEPAASMASRGEAIGYFDSAIASGANNDYSEQARYLKALNLEALNRVDAARQAWLDLASRDAKTIYGIRALIALGDGAFAQKRPQAALQQYEKANRTLEKLDIQDKDTELLRVQYRLAWAAFHAGQPQLVISSASKLLLPDRTMTGDRRNRMIADAIDLIGDALFEANDSGTTESALARRDIKEYAGDIGLRVLKRYYDSGLYQEATAIGELLAQKYPLSRHTPRALSLTGYAYEKSGIKPKQIATFERLAMLLPAESLWRQRFKDDFPATKEMEDLAVAANKIVAYSTYEMAMATGSVRGFIDAAAFFGNLIDHAPNEADAGEWRLRRANSFYFADQLDEAAALYVELKSKYKVTPDILQVASFQLVLCQEMRWRAALVSPNANESNSALKMLVALQQHVDEYASNFPEQSRTVDLLLVAASANRDMERFDRASVYWQRALISQPSTGQRAIAIRGLVFAALRLGNPGDVIKTASQFLKLEDWKTLGPSLANELRGILSTAALAEGGRLGRDGNVREAGMLMVQVAQEFKDLPQRSQIYRDGGYLLGVSGAWDQAQQAAIAYLKEDLPQHRADMMYLQGRSQEYQMRFADAARTYIRLAKDAPNFEHNVPNLERAEKFAVGEESFGLAGEAATLLGDRARDHNVRLAAYERAAGHLSSPDFGNRSVIVARRYLDEGKTEDERMKGELLVAKAQYKSGSQEMSIATLVALAQKVEQKRPLLRPQTYAEVSAECAILLGDEARRKFDSVQLNAGRSDGYAQKTKHYNELANHFGFAAKRASVRHASEARYKRGDAAEAFARELASLSPASSAGGTVKASSTYGSYIARLQDDAKAAYGENLVVLNQDSTRHRNNEWLRRSAQRLGSQVESALSTSGQGVDDTANAAINYDMPYQWSH